MSFILVIIVGVLIVYLNKSKKASYRYIPELSEIIIQESFKRHPPRATKMNAKMRYFIEKGIYEDPIVLDKDNVLIDGYTTYLLAKDTDVAPIIIKDFSI